MATILGLLALAQSLLSFLSVLRWRAFVRRYAAAQGPEFAPPVSLIVPCRGNEAGLAENLAAYAGQAYPDYELLLVTSGPEDPASAVTGGIKTARLVHASPRPDEGEKVTKLRAAVRAVRPGSRVLVFADSDGRPGRGWLRQLVAPLAQPEQEVGAATGYRWYVPAVSTGAALMRAVWNSFIATVLGRHSRNFCWGGSMALRRETFERIGVDRYWEGAVSDDYQLTRALAQAGLRVHFVPTCLVPNGSGCGWRELFSWTTRQIVITRVYAPRLWTLGLLANGIYSVAVVLLLAEARSPLAAAIATGLVLTAAATGLARLSGASAALPDQRQRLRRHALAFALATPVIPMFLLCNFVAAGLTRAIHWRGTTYRLEAPQQVRVLRRSG